MERFRGKKALVTGSTSGIGKAIAIKLAMEGASIIVTGRNESAGCEVANYIKNMGGAAHYIKADLTSYNEIDRLLENALRYLGQIDILINNAGIEILRPITETDMDDVERLFRVNFFAAYYLMHKVIPIMREYGSGVILNIASTAGLSPYPGGGPYCSSKAALIALSRVAALENAKYNIRVVALAPGLVETPMLYEGVPRDLQPSYLDSLKEKVLVGRIAKPEDIANVVAFLCSDEAWYINGSVVVVDGGMIAGRRESGNVPPTGEK